MTYDFAKPDIAIPQSDHARLLRLAETLARRNADLGDQLFQELERAEILPDGTTRAIVRMGATLDYETEDGETRTVTLVFPQDEDISAGRISVLTPVGIALIGLSAGQEMDWRTRDGRTQRLKVKAITAQPGNGVDPILAVPAGLAASAVQARR
jgi:regulator of nucleoside diphosphate kinase